MKARTKSSKQRWSLIYAFLFGCIVTYAFQHITNTNTNVNRMDALLLSSSSSFDPPPPTTTATATKIIYGHLHYIKSAGTNLNGQLASLYQNVCGNKGYSLDYYQYNERAQLTPNITYTRLAGGIDTLTQHSNSSGGSRGGGSSRAQPGKQAVEEIGFESCDYISYECSWLTWPRIVHDLQMKERNMKLELHIPCRDPIEHLMSLCNHKKRTFTCYDYNDDNDDDNDDNDEDNDSNVSNNNTTKTTTKKNKNLQLLEKEIHNCIVGKSLCGKYGCGIQTKEEIDTIRNNQMNIHQEYSRKYKKTLKYKTNGITTTTSTSKNDDDDDDDDDEDDDDDDDEREDDEDDDEREGQPEQSRQRLLAKNANKGKKDIDNNNNNSRLLVKEHQHEMKKTIAHQKVISANKGGAQFDINFFLIYN